jgi:hypothetical protein
MKNEPLVRQKHIKEKKKKKKNLKEFSVHQEKPLNIITREIT